MLLPKWGPIEPKTMTIHDNNMCFSVSCRLTVRRHSQNDGQGDREPKVDWEPAAGTCAADYRPTIP